MQPDEEGFLYPVRNETQCVLCGLCDDICPVTNNTIENEEYEQQCFVATTNESKYYLESATIGICTMLTESFISDGGVVFGAYLDENKWEVYHKKIEGIEFIDQIRNSKYSQSSTKETFTEVKTLLRTGNKVLYIGTPCQIAGLKAYLRKPYELLYTIDIICHGTFSPKLLPLEVRYWEKLFNSKLKNLRFRSKRKYKYENGGMVNFDIEKNGKCLHIERYAASSPSYRCFAYSGDGKSYNIRQSCYSCPFRALNRYGDITVGDPWYVKPETIQNKKLKPNNIIRSLYSTNTKKGIELISKITHYLLKEEVKRDNSFLQPALLPCHREIPPQREKLYSQLNTKDYGRLVEELFHCNLEDSHRAFEKSYRKLRIKKIIKKILFIK